VGEPPARDPGVEGQAIPHRAGAPRGFADRKKRHSRTPEAKLEPARAVGIAYQDAGERFAGTLFKDGSTTRFGNQLPRSPRHPVSDLKIGFST